jgi:hypothetical protein
MLQRHPAVLRYARGAGVTYTGTVARAGAAEQQRRHVAAVSACGRVTCATRDRRDVPVMGRACAANIGGAGAERYGRAG